MGDTSDRVIDLAGTTGGATIDHSGTNLLKLTGTISSSAAGIKKLTLQGSNATGTGEVAGVISDGVAGAVIWVVKGGSGTWTLSGDNTFSGGITNSGGTVVVTHPHALGMGGVGVNSGSTATFDLAHDGEDERLQAWRIYDTAICTIRCGRGTEGPAIDHAIDSAALSGITLHVTNGINVTSGTPTLTIGTVNLFGGSADKVTTLVPTTADLIIGRAAIYESNFANKTLKLDGTSTGSMILGSISNGLNTVKLTKANTGTWTLYGSNTYSGATAVDNGKLVVAGTDGAILGAGGITVSTGARLELQNSATTNNGDRLSDTASITMKGGILDYAHTGGAAFYSETAGTLVVNVKSNVLITSQADVGYTSALSFVSLSRTGDGLLDFRGEGLGADDRNRVFFTTPPSEGLIGLWATCNATNYAAYSNAYGVVAAGEGLFSDIPAQGPYTITDDATLNARITSEGVEGPLSLAGATTSSLKSLMQNSGWASTVAMTNQTLLLSEVVIAAGKQSLTLGAEENQGLVTPPGTGGALTLINRSDSGTLNLNAAVTNNAGTVSLGKYGSGAVKLTGRNSYTGTTLIDEGVLEFGGSLNQRLSGVISGAGTLTKSGTNQLQLLGANTFTGPVYINAGIVRPDQNNTFGTAGGGVFIADGATLDMGCDSAVGGTRGTDQLNMGAELFTVAGAGVGGAGAIVCNGGVNQANAINRISLSGDTTFGGGRRWDLRSNTPKLDLNDYTCTKTGANEIAIISTVITPGTGHFVVNQGLFRFEGSTTVNGTSNNTATVNSGGILELYQLYPSVPAWTLILNEGSFFRGSCAANNSATNINGWAGPVKLNGRAFFNGNASPCNWTVTGDISGPGTLVNAGNSGATLWLMGSNNTYNGETIISNGTLFAKYPGTIPGYDAGKVTLASAGTLAVPTGDGVTGWSAQQIENLHDSSTFKATTSGLSIDTTLTGIDYEGDLAKTLALTKNGNNTLTLWGANTFAGALRINKGDVAMNGSGNHKIGAVTIGNGTLVLTNSAPTYVYVTNSTAIIGNNTTEFGRMTVGGNSAWSSYLPPSGTGASVLYVGNNGRGILTLQDNATVSNRLYVGNASSGAGAVYQRGGTMAHWCGSSSDGRIGMTGYGYYELSNGMLTNNGYCQVGRDPSGIGILVMKGGKLVQNNGYGGDLTVSRGGTGVVDLVSGSYVSIPGMTLGGASDNGGARGFAELTIENDADASLGGTLLMADRTNMFATVNLLGGRLTANLFNKATRYGSLAFLNFNGGTFRARVTGNLFGTGVNALDGVTVYPGGATIDATNLNVTANANLIAPTGNGVASITVAPRGGYIGPPFVTISGGGGVGATAIAQFDSASGFVTGVTITSPGRDYTSPPTVQLSGGGTNLQTLVTGVTLAPNTSGGLTKLGSGTLTLTGTNTYGGATTLSAGTLKPTHALALPATTTLTFAGGTLDLNGLTLTNEVNTTGALTGGITNGTLQTVFSPGGENWIDTQTYALNVRSSSVLRGTYFMDAAANGASDVLAVQGNINLSNIDLQIVDMSTLNRSKQYTILTCTGTRTGTFSSNNLPDNRWHLLYGADGSVKLAFMDGTVFMLR